MDRILRGVAIALAALGLAAGGGALAQPKGKGHDGKEQVEGKGKQEHKKEHKHHDGKALLGDKIKQNGKHKFHEHGKFSAFANVQNGKIAGVSVTHAERGNVPVKKYKTTKKMAKGPTSASEGVRTPPVRMIVWSGLWGSCRMSATRTALVTTVRPTTSTSRRAIA